MRYLLDSDTVNYILKQIPVVADHFSEALRVGDEFVLSPLVHLEVTRYLKLKGARKMLRFYDSIVTRWERYAFQPADWDQAADLWAERCRLGRPIEDSDLLIAVSALKAGAILVTNNEEHYEGLGLVLENWTAAEATP